MRPSRGSLLLAAAAATGAITLTNHLLAPEPLTLSERDLDRWVHAPEIGHYAHGQARADSDLAAGKLVIETYGLPAPEYDRWMLVLERDYGIELRRVAGCVVSPDLEEQVRGYNEVMEEEIERRFGDDLLERAWAQAERESRGE